MKYLASMLLVDDHKLMLEGLKHLLRPHAKRFLEANDPGTAMMLARDEKPDLAILDYRLGKDTAEELIRDIRYHSPETRILVHSFSAAERVVVRSVDAGAHGFIQKGDDPAKLLEAVEALVSGKLYFNETARFYISQRIENGENHHHVETVGGISFNEKEIKIIKLLSDELSAKEIARRIFLSESSVEQYKIKIARKMGARNTIGILKFAFKYGMINQDDL